MVSSLIVSSLEKCFVVVASNSLFGVGLSLL